MDICYIYNNIKIYIYNNQFVTQSIAAFNGKLRAHYFRKIINVDPHFFADPDPGSQNLADPDPKQWNRGF